MSAPSTCTVSGSLLDNTGTAIAGASVTAYLTRPFVYSTTGALIADFQASTTTAADGSWSLVLVETTTDNVTMTVAFGYGTSSGSTARKEYTIKVPKTPSTATFTSLITGEI